MSTNPELQAILDLAGLMGGDGGVPMVSKKDAGMITDWDTMLANPHLINPAALQPVSTMEPYYGEGDAYLQMYQNGDPWQQSIAGAVMAGNYNIPDIINWIREYHENSPDDDFNEEKFEDRIPSLEAMAEPLLDARTQDLLKVQSGEVIQDESGQMFTVSTEPHGLDTHAMNSGYMSLPSETFSPYILFEEGRQEDDARVAGQAVQAQQAYDDAVAAWEEQYRDEWTPWRDGPAGFTTNPNIEGGEAAPARGASDLEMAALDGALGAGAQLPDEPKERPPLPTYAEDVSAQPYVGVDLGTGLPNIPGVDLEAMLTTPSATPSGQTGGVGFDVANAARRIAEEQNYVPPMDDRVHETYMRAISTNDGSDQQYIAPQFIRADESSLRKGRSNGEAGDPATDEEYESYLSHDYHDLDLGAAAGYGGGIAGMAGALNGNGPRPFGDLAGRWGLETPTHQVAQYGGHTYFSNGGRVKNITEAERERRKLGELQTIAINRNAAAKYRDKLRAEAGETIANNFTAQGWTPFSIESYIRNASGGLT